MQPLAQISFAAAMGEIPAGDRIRHEEKAIAGEGYTSFQANMLQKVWILLNERRHEKRALEEVSWFCEGERKEMRRSLLKQARVAHSKGIPSTEGL
jgi:hypothetical protein